MESGVGVDSGEEGAGGARVGERGGGREAEGPEVGVPCAEGFEDVEQEVEEEEFGEVVAQELEACGCGVGGWFGGAEGRELGGYFGGWGWETGDGDGPARVAEGGEEVGDPVEAVEECGGEGLPFVGWVWFWFVRGW